MEALQGFVGGAAEQTQEEAPRSFLMEALQGFVGGAAEQEEEAERAQEPERKKRKGGPERKGGPPEEEEEETEQETQQVSQEEEEETQALQHMPDDDSLEILNEWHPSDPEDGTDSDPLPDGDEEEGVLLSLAEAQARREADEAVAAQEEADIEVAKAASLATAAASRNVGALREPIMLDSQEEPVPYSAATRSRCSGVSLRLRLRR